MLNFHQLVNILLEQSQTNTNTGESPDNSAQADSQTTAVILPDWFIDILNVHKKLGLGNVTETDVIKIFPLVTKNYVSSQDAQRIGKNILIFDLLKNLWDTASPKPKNIRSFFSNEGVIKNGKQERDIIIQYTDKKQWEVTNGLVANALGKQPGKSRIDYLTQTLGAIAGFAGASLYAGR